MRPRRRGRFDEEEEEEESLIIIHQTWHGIGPFGRFYGEELGVAGRRGG